jgi:hypothetical protein
VTPGQQKARRDNTGQSFVRSRLGVSQPASNTTRASEERSTGDGGADRGRRTAGLGVAVRAEARPDG